MKTEVFIGPDGKVERKIDFEGAKLPNGESIDEVLEENKLLKEKIAKLKEETEESLKKKMQDIKIKKRVPNIIIGLLFGILAMYFSSSWLSYVFYTLSILAFTFTDQMIKMYTLTVEKGNYSLKGPDVKMTVKDKSGNIKSEG